MLVSVSGSSTFNLRDGTRENLALPVQKEPFLPPPLFFGSFFLSLFALASHLGSESTHPLGAQAG
jgi:hypothetical protein